MSSKATKSEYVAIYLTVIAFILSIVNVAMMKGYATSGWETGRFCASTQTPAAIPVYFIDLMVCILALVVFVRTLNQVSLATKSVRIPSTNLDESMKRSPANAHYLAPTQMEVIARDARNGGGGAILLFLANFFVSFMGIGSHSDVVILTLIMVNNLTVFLMCFVIAHSTRKVWEVTRMSRVAGLFVLSVNTTGVSPAEQHQSLSSANPV
jgi:hypothetical protein